MPIHDAHDVSVEILLQAKGEGKRSVCDVLGDTNSETRCSLNLEDGSSSEGQLVLLEIGMGLSSY